MQLSCPHIISLCSIDLIAEIPQVVSFFIHLHYSGPFFSSLVPADTLILRTCTVSWVGIATVLGGRAYTKVTFAVIQPVMVYMVHHQMVRGTRYHSMHRHSFSLNIADRVKGMRAGNGVPLMVAQPVIVIRIDDGEFSKGNRYYPLGVHAEFEIGTRVEIPARVIKADFSPFTLEVALKSAHQHRPINPHHVGRKNAVIAADMIRISYVVMRIA